MNDGLYGFPEKLPVQEGNTPIGGLVAFDSQQTGNTVAAPDGAVYLKTGVIAPATTYPAAASSPYVTSTLSDMSSIASKSAGYSTIASSGTIAVFVGGGANPLPQTTTDGFTWTTAASTFPGSSGDLAKAIHWNGSLFMVVSDLGKVWTSPDGLVWTQRTTLTGGVANKEWAIGFGNSRWMLHGSSLNTAQYSLDNGANWTTSGTGISSITHNYSGYISFGAGLFVLVNHGTTGPTIFTSADGVTWTVRSVTGFSSTVSNTVRTSTHFVIAGRESGVSQLRHSTDGITWSNANGASSVVNNTNRIYVFNDKLVIADEGGGVVNTTGSNPTTGWTTTGIPIAKTTPGGTILYNAQSVNGVFFANAGSETLYSLDGISWGVRGKVSATFFNPMVHRNGLYLAGANTGIGLMLASKDGTNFFSYYPRGRSTYSDNTFALTASTTGWVCRTATAGNFWKSTDGVVWTAAATPTDATNAVLSSAGARIYSALAAGATTISYSDNDGTSWTQITGLPATIGGGRVLLAGGLYLLYGGNNAVYSANGTSGWTQVSTAQLPSGSATSIVHDGTAFYATDGNGVNVYRSTNAVTWTLLTRSYRTNITSMGPLCVIGGSVFNAGNASGSDFQAVTSTQTFNRSSPSMAWGTWVVGTNVIFDGTTSSTGTGRLTLQANQVLNDINLKTYNATANNQTDFYERVA